MLDGFPAGRYRSPMRRAQTPSEIAVVDLRVCDRCGLCLPLCPPEAIHLELADLVVDQGTCTGCRKCIAPCPVGALKMIAA
jgi:Na+-translocating ferredoxin:NAD+ oxidoreductase subunit B